MVEPSQQMQASFIKSENYPFQCRCGETFPPVQIQEHFFKCELVKKEYGDLLMQLGDHMEKQQSLIQMKNFYAILQFFMLQLEPSIKSMDRVKPIVKMPGKIDGDHHMNGSDYSDIARSSSYSDGAIYSICKSCKQKITPEDEQASNMTMIQSTDCFHMIHRKCFVNIAFESYTHQKTPCCPECDKIIQDVEIRQTLNEEEQKKLDQETQMILVRQNPNLIQCQCGNILEIVPSMPDYGVKDEQGKAISKEAAENMAKCRIRCDQCQNNFCCSCSTTPYHLGKTCEQQQIFKEARKCRFCFDTIPIGSAPPSAKLAFKNVCRKKECVDLMGKCCDKMLTCGHTCFGFSNELKCLPCLNQECVEKNKAATFEQDEDTFCSICYISGLGCQASVMLDCKHIFHIDCIMTKIKKRWPGPRITFNFLECPSCKQRISAKHCPPIAIELADTMKIEKEVKTKAVERAKTEGIDKHERLLDPNSPYYGKLEEFALFKLSFYQCFKCKDPYFGGMKDCEAGQDLANYKPEELVCGKCAVQAVGLGKTKCDKHGTDYIEFKCRFCCSIAQWFCWGSTHFCEACHKKQVGGDYVSKKNKSQLPQCPGAGKCALKVAHPPNGDEFSLGCAVCRNLGSNMK